jgi:DNA invertase Pin-like site-specific DNA recombinase
MTKPTTTVIKAFAYLRVSGRGQIDGDGFPRQLSAVKAYAAHHGVKIARVFEEKGVSGTNELADRPAFVELLTALHADGVRLVLVESLGRLARDLMIQESIIHDLKRHGFEIVSVVEPDLCGDDPSRKLMRQIMGAFHEYEKTMLVCKLHGARQRMKAKTGACEGRKPYGHYPGEQPVLDRMTALRTSGSTYEAIASTLNGEGVKPRNQAAKWHAGYCRTCSLSIGSPSGRELLIRRLREPRTRQNGPHRISRHLPHALVFGMSPYLTRGRTHLGFARSRPTTCPHDLRPSKGCRWTANSRDPLGHGRICQFRRYGDRTAKVQWPMQSTTCRFDPLLYS